MSMRALTNIYTITQSVPAQALSGASVTGSAIANDNCIENVFVFNFGTWVSGTLVPSLTYSGTAGGAGTYTAVAAADQVGTLVAVSSTATSAVVQKVSYIGAFRYIKPVVTTTVALTTAIPVCVQAIQKLRSQTSST